LTHAGSENSTMSPDDPLEGTPYRALKQIGKGAMGVVFEAEHRVLKRRVCVKLMNAELVADDDNPDAGHELYTQTLDRMRLAVLDQHPNILRFHDLGCTSAKRPYLVIELLEGRTLKAEVEARGPLPVDEAVRIATDCLSALSHAHQHGVIHRDIKPANLFISRSSLAEGRNQVKVIDFGLAKIISAGESGPRPLFVPTREGMLLGTPRYLAPEQISGDGIGPATDLYAVACLLFVMLTRRGPFDHCAKLEELALAHLFETPQPLHALSPAVSEELSAVIAKALAKKPEDRWPSAKAFSDALSAATLQVPAEMDASTIEMPRLARPAAFVSPRETLKLADAPTSAPPEPKPRRATEPLVRADSAVPRVARAAPRSGKILFVAVVVFTVVAIVAAGIWLLEAVL
jgi:eukaryotic-like serine/threonine-protein kinase